MLKLLTRYGPRAITLNKTLATDHSRSLLATVLLLCSFAIAAADEPLDWSAADHQPHFGDVNGDAVADLLLQAATPTGQSLLITASVAPAPQVSQIIFIHSDLLGSPALESNQQGEEQ